MSFELKLNAAAKRLLKRKKKLGVKLQVKFKAANGAAPAINGNGLRRGQDDVVARSVPKVVRLSRLDQSVNS